MAMIVVTQGGILCDSVYGMFDEDNSGSMDFQENMTVIIIIISSQCWWYEGKRALEEVKCIQAKFAMMMSTPEEKLSWIFEIFDSDGGGKKNRWEVTKWFAFHPSGPSSSVKDRLKYLKTNCAGGVIEMDEIEEVVEGIFRFAGITVIMLDSYNFRYNDRFFKY